VSAPEPRASPERHAGVRLRSGAMDIVQLAALPGRARELERIAAGRALQLPALGHAALATDQLSLCVRPERWLLLGPPASHGASARRWHAACADVGAALDLSSGLSALHLAGPAAREVLVRGCRLDLDPQAFPVGAAAATIMAQVSVILAALPSGVLLLTPSTTAQHVRAWLAGVARPFGLLPQTDFTLAELSGDQPT
jgi:heterotetrameric sarcosine oxidase gamma subunit